MRCLAIAALLCVEAMTSLQMVAKPAPCVASRAAPAPAIGSGVPAARRSEECCSATASCGAGSIADDFVAAGRAARKRLFLTVQ